MKDDGTNNSAYHFPKQHTTIWGLIKHSRMSPDAGECFRLMYLYATEGRYDVPSTATDIIDLCSHHDFKGFVFDAMQGLYRHGYGNNRNTLVRDIQKAHKYILEEHKRLEVKGLYSECLDEAVILIKSLLVEVEKEQGVDKHVEMDFGDDTAEVENDTPTVDNSFNTTWHNQFSEEVGLLNEKIRAMENKLSPEQSQYEKLLMNALIIMDYKPDTNEHQTARANIYKALEEFYEEPATSPCLEDLLI